MDAQSRRTRHHRRAVIVDAGAVGGRQIDRRAGDFPAADQPVALQNGIVTDFEFCVGVRRDRGFRACGRNQTAGRADHIRVRHILTGLANGCTQSQAIADQRGVVSDGCISVAVSRDPRNDARHRHACGHRHTDGIAVIAGAVITGYGQQTATIKRCVIADDGACVSAVREQGGCADPGAKISDTA